MNKRVWLADYIALTSFNTVILGLCELFIIGLSPITVFKARTFAAILNLVNGYLYGLFRGFWAKICKTGPKSTSLRKFITDTSSNVIYGTSFYILILYISGADPVANYLRVLFTLLFAFTFGRLYGIYHDFIRARFKVKPILENE